MDLETVRNKTLDLLRDLRKGGFYQDVFQTEKSGMPRDFYFLRDGIRYAGSLESICSRLKKEGEEMMVWGKDEAAVMIYGFLLGLYDELGEAIVELSCPISRSKPKKIDYTNKEADQTRPIEDSFKNLGVKIVERDSGGKIIQ